MPLTIKDLREHEKKLTEIIKHAEEERGAIRLLIKGMELRSNGDEPDRPISANMTVADAITKGIEYFSPKGFTTNDLVSHLISVGFRKSSQRKNFRPNVANRLKELCSKGILQRRNISRGHKPLFKYKLVSESVAL